ncbi:unnamed protein product [Urochloa humidicola]
MDGTKGLDFSRRGQDFVGDEARFSLLGRAQPALGEHLPWCQIGRTSHGAVYCNSFGHIRRVSCFDVCQGRQ